MNPTFFNWCASIQRISSTQVLSYAGVYWNKIAKKLCYYVHFLHHEQVKVLQSCLLGRFRATAR